MLLTRAPVATKSIATLRDAPRLACVRPVASVHPEPGSNSSLYLFFLLGWPSFLFPSRYALLFLIAQKNLNWRGIMFLSLFFFIILLFVLSLFNHFKDRSSGLELPARPHPILLLKLHSFFWWFVCKNLPLKILNLLTLSHARSWTWNCFFPIYMPKGLQS